MFILFCDLAIACAVFGIIFSIRSDLSAASKKAYKRVMAKSFVKVSACAYCLFGVFTVLTLLSYVFNL